MAALVLQIIGTVVLVVLIIALAIALPLLSRLLKKLNKSLHATGRSFKGQMKSTVSNIDIAQGQLQSFGAMTTAARAGMGSAIGVTDKIIAFLKSGAFQAGLPVVAWFLFLVVAIPRSLFHKKKVKKVKPIPPDSWEVE